MAQNLNSLETKGKKPVGKWLLRNVLPFVALSVGTYAISRAAYEKWIPALVSKIKGVKSAPVVPAPENPESDSEEA